jgi:beta-lactamase class A
MSRVRVLLSVVLVVASLAAGRPAAASTQELVQQLDQLSAGFPGGVGLWIADPNATKPLYARNADEHIITASLYKLGVLAEAERRVDSGDLHYGDVITILPEDITEDGSFEAAYTELTLDQALEAMITISDNGAAQALWHLLGGENIDATLTKLGMPDFHVAYDSTEDNVATPRAIGTFFTLLAKKQLVSPAASDRMLARLGRQEINDRLPAALPDKVIVAHKTGNLAGITHDAGIIYTPSGPRVVVAMTWDSYQEEAVNFIANIGAIVYSAVLEPPANARYSVPRAAVVGNTDSKLRVTVTVTNAGSNAWTASGPDAVGLIWELRDDPGNLVTSSPTAIRLPALAAGKAGNVGLQIATPFGPGMYHVTVGLVDSNGRALSLLGAATATFDVKTHLPFLVNASVGIPTTLRRDEASLLVTKYAALGTAGIVDHNLVLTWRAIDQKTSRTAAQGTTPVGVLKPGSDGMFFSAIVGPKVMGTYKLSYELREGDVAVSETSTTTINVIGPRTYPDDNGGRTPGPITIAPSATPRVRLPFPSPSGSFVPNVNLPALPTVAPRGKPTPKPR